MKKWALGAFVYLLVIMGGYWVYDVNFKTEAKTSMDMSQGSTAMTNESHGHNESGEEHHHESDSAKIGEVNPNFVYKDGKMEITLKDTHGKLVNDLEVNHEKLMHLIVVNNHLDQYYHIHPEKIGPGKFAIPYQLADGQYKAFIDVKPKNLNYKVEPVSFTVGSPVTSHNHPSLIPDRTFVKTIDGEKVEMKVSSFDAGNPVTLKFQLDESKLEPYLGAAGHVVILNEQADQYLHVHPSDEHQPVFETQFNHPGIYKIWAEFKQDGKVRVFPFIIKIS
ncbi:hypothetical protein BIV60_23200 [Bacillus sp. MUM 116]|uniref:hypothetical protein n=1 Tax=Bacillus sp. MUM 116 TaxID=1678002 RepID=UPI0008F5E2CA|nr:hypothetical protein [Bacillus sp. MUM 116]OIK09721.1 hypothetical protein BIV60_23200 [Bacillus sp. MUM 116]